jgi:single-strand DNA-binding protein
VNNFSVVGRVGRDAVVRHTADGEQVAGFSVAVDSGYGDKKKTLWLDVSVWGKRAEALAKHVKKGDRIGVVGELGTREHEGKTYLTLRAGDVSLMSDKKPATAAA